MILYAKSVKEVLVMVGTGQKMARGKDYSMSGKCQGISLRVGESLSL